MLVKKIETKPALRSRSVWAEVGSGIASDPQKVGRSATGGNPYQKATTDYQRWRPEYPAQVACYALCPEMPAAAPERWFTPAPTVASRNFNLPWISEGKAPLNPPGLNWNRGGWQSPNRGGWQNRKLRVLDVGAGSGKFTAALTATGMAEVTALEPAPAMVEQFKQRLPQIPLATIGAEEMAAKWPAQSFEVITFAQCWHWLKIGPTCAAARKLLTPGGHLSIIFNQLNVTIPWVKRLSRVMRSGDVHFPERPPKISGGFETPQLRLLSWGQELLVKDLFELGKTRSSYLRATPAGQTHLRQNLAEFLYEEESLRPEQLITLPYYTLIWTVRRSR